MEKKSNSSAPSFVTETIVALATPYGEAALGIIRLSGAESLSIAKKIFYQHNPPQSTHNIPTKTLLHGKIIDEKVVIDDSTALFYQAPHSYTGEDAVEFICHGSPAVLDRVIRLIQNQGARLARPGEFTERAFLNGKMDLAQAEAVADLIHSRADASRRIAVEQLAGRLSNVINELRSRLLVLLADLEANLDFAEEDIPVIDREKLSDHLSAIKKDIYSLLQSIDRGRLYRSGIRVALAGRPNVGKSSLFNAFLVQDRAIVTDIPGTTRDTLEEKIQWQGIPIILTDTAGLRTTENQIEKLGTARSEKTLSQADVALLVLDGTTALTEEDKRILNMIENKTAVIAVNKCDKKAVLNLDNEILSALKKPIVFISALTGKNCDELKQEIIRVIFDKPPLEDNSLVIQSARHAELLSAAHQKLDSLLSALEKKDSEEMLAVDLRDAVMLLGQITGHDFHKDLLDSIFSRFCIGK